MFLRVENSESWIRAARRLNALSSVAVKTQRSSVPLASLAVWPKEWAVMVVETMTASTSPTTKTQVLALE